MFLLIAWAAHTKIIPCLKSTGMYFQTNQKQEIQHKIAQIYSFAP